MTDEVSDGWHTPEDRKLMVRAVARFSDQCDIPNLTPECPYFERSADGTPVCAEQCKDLIARYPGDLLPGTSVGIGPGLSATRRPTRRGPAADERAFDSREAQLEDAEKAVTEWRFSSLMRACRDFAFSPNETDLASAHVSREEVIGELQRRGINVDVVLPLALASDRRSSVYMAFLLASHDNPADLAYGAEMTEHLDEWRSVLANFNEVTDVDDWRMLFTRDARRAIFGWLASAPWEVVVADVVPTVEDLRAGMTAPHLESSDLARDAKWLLDRFTITYLEQWAPSSTQREWQFIKAARSGCARPSVMRERLVDPQGLSALLADQFCARQDDDAEQGTSWSETHFQMLAINRLKQGRFDEAVQIFRVQLQLKPDDPDTLNNLGFCLISTAPKEAIHVLTAALDNGVGTVSLTTLNLALASHLAGDRDRALALTLRVLEEGTNQEDVYVWQVADHALTLTLRDDVLGYGEDLVDHISTCPGDCVLVGLLDGA